MSHSFRRIWLLAIMALVIGPFATPLATHAAAVTGIVYERDQDLYAVQPNGKGRVRLTFGEGGPYMLGPAVWSPDARNIAYDIQYGDETHSLTVLNASTGAERLTIEGFAPAWSPDSRQIVYAVRGASNDGIFVARVDGKTPPKRIASGNALFSLAWSPTGQSIAFITYPPNQPVSDDGDLMLVNPDGTGLRRIQRNVGSFDWSPDGQRIAFSSMRGDSDDVYVMRADGSNLRRLTTMTTAEWAPLWSPDGRRLVVQHRESPDSDSDLMIMNADGTNLIFLANSVASEIAPSWSPDSAFVTYEAFAPGDTEAIATVYIVDNKGGTPRQLIVGESPSWQPNGSPRLTLTNPAQRGSGAYEAQRWLTDLGYKPGSIDGVYGKQTAAAVTTFQTRNGLTADGVVNAATWTALRSTSAKRAQ